ncbi:Leucyl aminopeptidase (aminopeptidase T) [Alicyclobacillus hesperidum]|uniref:Leucyl aminopeptidase (Aminopeptidase T) n=2 Tax=Alicyclobacillus hesperidum TaxID=89784 RepID=A0A1H2UQP5_9BACL|nr:Leucyl aminopeptidase (aminopeptidase T) [Alicyclobacillus hesperidum]
MSAMALLDAARNMLVHAMDLKAGESLLVVSDGTRDHICRSLWQAGKEIGAEAMIIEMVPRDKNGAEPPVAVAVAMAAADVVVCPTLRSLTHTQARRRASECGARVATMPGVTEDMFEHGPMTADFDKVAQLTECVAKRLTAARDVRIEKDGAVFTCSLAGRRGIASTGVYLNPGEAGNAPSGEAFIAPMEGSAQGELVVDGSLAGLGLVKSPLRLVVRDGLLVTAEGDGADKWLEMLGDTPAARNVAELGIGTNDKARLTGVILEDEKALGTVHVAFGSNATFGGTVSAGVHLDVVMLAPTLYLDGEMIMQEGKLLV